MHQHTGAQPAWNFVVQAAQGSSGDAIASPSVNTRADGSRHAAHGSAPVPGAVWTCVAALSGRVAWSAAARATLRRAT